MDGTHFAVTIFWAGFMCKHFCILVAGAPFWIAWDIGLLAFFYLLLLLLLLFGVDSTDCARVVMDIAPHLILIHFANPYHDLLAFLRIHSDEFQSSNSVFIPSGFICVPRKRGLI